MKSLIWVLTLFAVVDTSLATVASDIDELFQQDPSLPGCAVGYARDGKVEYVKGFGIANLEHQVPITSQTRFHIASVSKQFTGAAIGLLLLEGKITLSDDVRKHLPQFRDYGHVITINHLLQHTSGLRNHTKLMGLEGIDYGNSTSQQRVLDLIFEEELKFEPGEKFDYSSGYLVLASVVEKVTGMPFREFLRQRFFNPLGMKSSGLHDDFSIIPNRAEGYLQDSGRWINDRVRYALVGSGGLHMSVNDLLVWSHALRNEMLAKGLTELIFDSPRFAVVPEVTEYHFGLFHSQYRQQPLSWHSGSYQGSRTTVVNFEPDTTTVVACNHQIDTEELSWKLVAKIAAPSLEQ